MSWRDNLLSATYENISFYVLTSTYSFGRRGVLHDYPFSELPQFFEDVGADSKQFGITGYIIQNKYNNYDYFFARNLLADALHSKNPGTLIHPFYGARTVVPFGRPEFAESFTEGGVVRFSIVFVEVSEIDIGAPSEDDLALIDSTLDAAASDSEANFITNLTDSLAQVPDIIKDVARGDVVQFATSVTKGLANFRGYLSENIRKVITELQTRRVILFDLLNTPADFAAEIRYLADSVAAAIDIEGLAPSFAGIEKIPATVTTGTVNILSRLQEFGTPLGTQYQTSKFGSDLPEIPRTSAIDIKRSNNRIGIIRNARFNLLLNQIKIAIRSEYDTKNIATEVKYSIFKSIENLTAHISETEYLDNTSMLASLVSVATKFSTFIDKQIITAQSVRRRQTGPYGDNLLTITYDIYGNLDNIADVFSRNRTLTRHPGFFPANADMEFVV